GRPGRTAEPRTSKRAVFSAARLCVSRSGKTYESGEFTRIVGRALCSPAPDVARDLQGQPELAFLVLDRDLVAVVRAGEAALGAQAEIFQRDVLRGRFDAALGVVLRRVRGHFLPH